MTRTIVACACVLLATVLYLSAPGSAEAGQAPPPAAPELQAPEGATCADPLQDNEDRLVPMVSCGMYQGKPCNGTTRPRCDLIPGEPAICLCVNGTFECS